MKPKYFKNQIVLVFLWFVLIFGPVLDLGFGSLSDTSVAIAVLLSFRLLWVGVRKIDIFMVACLMGIFILACVTFVIADQGSLSLAIRAILRPIRAVIVFLGMLSLADYTVRKIQRFEATEMAIVLNGIFLIYLTVVVHGLIMAGQFVSPNFKNSIYSLTFAKNQLDFYQEFRMAGLSGAGGAQVSAVQGMGVLIGLYLFMRGYARAAIVLTIPVVVLSIFLSGRTGFTVLSIGIIFSLYLLFVGGARGIGIKQLVAIVGSTILLILLIDRFAQVFVGNDFFEVAFNRNFDSLLRYSRTGSFQDNTLNALADMFVLPETFLHLLFGQASFIENNTHYDINTDIGYFRLIWAYGFIGLIFHFLFYFGFVLFSVMNGAVNTTYKYFSFTMIFVILFLNSKEIFFLTSMSFPMMGGCILLGRYLVENRRSYVRRKLPRRSYKPKAAS